MDVTIFSCFLLILTIDNSLHCHTGQETCCFFPVYFWYQTPMQRWVVHISKECCGDGEMWVSVLVLGAAEHPVPLLSGPPYPLCLSVSAR